MCVPQTKISQFERQGSHLTPKALEHHPKLCIVLVGSHLQTFELHHFQFKMESSHLVPFQRFKPADMSQKSESKSSKGIILRGPDQWEVYKHQVMLNLGAESLLQIIEKPKPNVLKPIENGSGPNKKVKKEEGSEPNTKVKEEEGSQPNKKIKKNDGSAGPKKRAQDRQDEKNYRALVIINRQLSEELLMEFKDVLDAYKLWSRLNDRFHGGMLASAAAHGIEHIFSLSSDGNCSTCYIQQFKLELERYTMLTGTTFNEITQVGFFLNGLEDCEWGEFKDEIKEYPSLVGVEDLIVKFKLFSAVNHMEPFTDDGAEICLCHCGSDC